MLKSVGRTTLVSLILLSLGMIALVMVLYGADEVLRGETALQVDKGMISGVSAESFYVFDVATEESVVTRSADSVLPIASVTKLFSVMAFYDSVDLEAQTTITWSDVNTEGRSGRLQASDTYDNRDLLFPALLESSNDASVAMYRTADIDLIEVMNLYAETHGASKTVFTDTSGLSSQNVSTARELGQLSRSMFYAYPYLFDITRLKTYFNHINAWMNNNPFAQEEGYRGGKHGFTYEANRTAVAFFDEVLDGGESRVFGYVLLGSDDLVRDMQILRQYVRQNARYE